MLIKIQPNKDNVQDKEIFEVVLEYFEKIHNKFNDDDKKIATNLFSDAYFVFREKEDNMEKFMIDAIYRMIELICACTENKYELSKILYFNKNYKSKTINKDIIDFNNIINIKKNKEFNLKELYNELKPFDPETGDEFNFKEFIEYIEENYNNDDDDDDDAEFNFNNPDNIYSSDIFEKLILYLYMNISDERLKRFKNIYIKAVDTLFIASTRILQIMREQREKRLQLPDFVENIKKFHINNLKF